MLRSTIVKAIRDTRIVGTSRALTTSAARCLKEGDTVTVARTISSSDVALYSDLVGDHNPVHLRTEDGRRGPLHFYINAVNVLLEFLKLILLA